MSIQKPKGPVTVLWAVVVGVDHLGQLYMIDHEYALEVRSSRLASLDDIDAACAVASGYKDFHVLKPSPDSYTVAFLVFQMPDGHVAASPDVFEDVTPVTSPSNAQIVGAFHVLRSQIIAQRTADLVAPLAVQATLSVLNQMAVAMDPDAAKKTQGGLYVA